MARFVVMAGKHYVTAVYSSEGNGIGLTPDREAACGWVTYERAVEAARIVAKCLGGFVSVHSVAESHQPKSWAAAKN